MTDLRKTRGGSSARYRSEYNAWINMLHRCFNPEHPQYKDYGGRGIWVHPDWIWDWDAFFAYVGPKPDPSYSLDRIDNNRDYEPGNIRWASRQTQQRNMRSNRWITINGETRTLTEWSEVSGIAMPTLRHRFDRGWDPEEAVTVKPSYRNYRCHTVEIDGVKLSIRKHCARVGLSETTVYGRIRRGMSLPDAFEIANFKHPDKPLRRP